MKVLEAKYAIVTNPEVADLLKEQGVDRGLGGKGQQALWTYLTEQGAHEDGRETVATFLGALKEHSFTLSRAEKVQLVNLRPQSDLELQVAMISLVVSAALQSCALHAEGQQLSPAEARSTELLITQHGASGHKPYFRAIPNSSELSSDERVRELVALIKEHLAVPTATEAPVEEA